MKRAILCAVLAAASAAAFADQIVPKGETATFSGVVSPGTVTLKDGASAIIEPNTTVSNATIVFSDKFTTTTVGAGSTLVGGGFNYSGSGYGADSHSNTVVVCGPGTTWTGPKFLERNFGSPVFARGDKWTTVVFTNGVTVTNAAFASSALDEKNSLWLFEDASFSFTSGLALNYSTNTTIDVAKGATFSGGGGLTLDGRDNLLDVHGEGTVFKLAGTLSFGGRKTRFRLRDGATAVLGAVGDGAEMTDCQFSVSGTNTALAVSGDFDIGSNASPGSELVIEDGATLTASKLSFASGAPAGQSVRYSITNSQIVVRNGATVSVVSIFPNGRSSYSGGGFRNGLLVSNATCSASSQITFPSVGSVCSNWFHAVADSVVSATNLYVRGPGMQVLIDDSTVSVANTFADSGFGTPEVPARITFRGTHPRLSMNQFSGYAKYGSQIGACELVFDIPAGGRTSSEPCLTCGATFQSADNGIFPKENVTLSFNIDRRWACSGEKNYVDLIEITENKCHSGCFTALTNTVDMASLKGCRLEYLPNRKGGANRLLRLYAGKRIGLTLIVR